jgi:alpha-L-fucosidase
MLRLMRSSVVKSTILSLAIGALCIVLGVWAESRQSAAAAVSLAGTWRFALDRADVGVKEQWFSKDLKDRINLPGALQAQGYGDEISTSTPWVLSLYDRHWYLREDYKAYTQPGHVKVPFLCQPPRHYLGAAWYQRDIDIPQPWQGRRVVLILERPRWETTVWVDERKIGSNNSLVAPHIYDLGTLAPGKHRLSIRADNRMIMAYRPDAHSVSDSLGSSWNGIVGKIELTSTTPVWIDDAQVFPNVAKKTALIKVQVGNSTGEAGTGTLSAGGVAMPVTWDANGAKAELEVPLGTDAQLWDEFNPVLHRLTLQLRGEPIAPNGADDRRELVFGLRQLRAERNQFVLNGRPTIFRGTHHGGDFPLTGYPPTDVEYWKKIIRICQAWGLNHIRFHSFCPPEAAFIAADELGFYFQPEAGMWNQISPGTEMERMMYEETQRMIKAYGNHPSFLLMSPSNEPGGRWKESLPKWVEHFRREDPRRLYTTGTGWSLIDVPGPVAGADYLAVHRIGQNMLRRESAWFGLDYRKSLTGVNVPVATHEVGQWCAYPDFDVIQKFNDGGHGLAPWSFTFAATGYLRPGNYEIFRDSMTARGLLEKNKDFAWASGRFQLACYKEEIEANLRTPGLGGFQLLDLHDYVGQGTALVGLLDPFWEPKGYATAEEFRRFCNTTVPLARLMKRVFTTADSFEVDVEVAHYGAEPIINAVPVWKVINASGATVAQGQWPARTIPIGKNLALGKVAVDLAKLAAPQAYKLVVGIQGTSFENDWNFWLYPQSAIRNPQSTDVLVTNSWEQADARLLRGGKVLFLPRAADLDWTSPPLDRVPVFWNRLMGPAWSRMLGLWINSKHPALAKFPTEAHGDWQWIELVRNARAVNLDRLPRALQPTVQPIDDWNRNYKLGLVFEAKVGRGWLMVCSVDLESSLETRPVARQLRRSLLDYMDSPRFQPQVVVSAEDIRGLFFDTQIMKKLGAVAQAQGEAANAIDGDPHTAWLSGGPRSGARHPHELTISFPAPVTMSGLVLMPRQNHREHEGDIREYVIQVSDDGQQWREVKRGALVSTFAPQSVRFSQPVSARHLKLTALSGFGPDATASLAELAVIYAGPKDEGVTGRKGAVVSRQSLVVSEQLLPTTNDQQPTTTSAPPAPYSPVPSPRQLQWHELEFYGFVHFSINTFTDKEWGYGDEDPALFNPIDFDAGQIVRTAQEAGMKGLILTAKHHDGFCLWPSKYTEHSVKNSPWKGGRGDVVKEISAACRKYGIKFGIYLSPWDRNHKDYGRPAYLTYFRNQLRELLTGYGPIFEVFLDGANGGDGYYGGARETRRIDRETYYDWPNTWQLVRRLQPDACLFSDAGPDVRWVGNERGMAGETCWATSNREDFVPGRADEARLNRGDRPGTHWVPAECDVSIRPGWFYHAQEDDKVRAPQNLVDLYYASVGRGASLLLNLPPDRRGRIHGNDVKSLREFRRLLDATFANDLAQGAKASASNVRSSGHDKRFSPQNVIDNKRNTYWATDDHVTTPDLILDLGREATFNVVRVREYLPLGQRVEAFALDMWRDGQWIEFAAGTSIGNCRLVRRQPVTTSKVRLRITQAPVCPAISELALFAEPQ